MNKLDCAAPRQLELDSLFVPLEIVPQGGGSYLVKPGRPVEKLTIQEAARISRRSVFTIYRLYHAGIIRGERPSPNGILIYAESLQKHLEQTRDPGFWNDSQTGRPRMTKLSSQEVT